MIGEQIDCFYVIIKIILYVKAKSVNRNRNIKK